MIIDRLYREAIDISPICLGLDTDKNYLPECLLESRQTLSEKIFQFNKDIIDNTFDLVACYKVQIAYYEALGIDGLTAYSKTLKYIKQKNKISIADIKRGDILDTGRMYAKGHFEGDFEADMITVNTYMGKDSVLPYYPYIKDKGKGIFVLLKTSNQSAVETQDVVCGDKKYYQHMAKLIVKWADQFDTKCGYSPIGAVVGLTYPKEFEILQKLMPNTFFLVPGYGAQGGKGEDMARILNKRRCAVVNSSRGLITAHKGVNEKKNYWQEIRKATIRMKEDIESCIR